MIYTPLKSSFSFFQNHTLTMKNNFFSKGALTLLVLCFLLFNTSVIAEEGVSIICPCTFERVNDTKANISFSISFRSFSSANNMTIRLVGREDQASQNIWYLGEATLEGFNYSSEVIPIDIKISLNGHPETNTFIDLVLETSSGETLDRVHLTEMPINYHNSGYEDFGVSSPSIAPIFIDSNINFSYTDSTFRLNIPEISSNALKSTSDEINIRLYVAKGLSYYEKANINYTLEYDAQGGASINFEDYLDRAIDSHLWYAPTYTDVILEFWKDNIRLLHVLMENLDGELIPSRQLILSNIDTLIDADLDGISDFNERLIDTDPQSFTNFSSRNVEIGFSSGTVISESYTDAQIEAKILDYIATTNMVFNNSGLNLKVTSVGHAVLGNDSSHTLVNLRERTGIFSTLDDKFVRKPDLIVHLTTYDELGMGGIAAAQGSMSDGVIPYAVSYDQGANVAIVAVDSSSLTFTHELGHLFGLGHSKREDSSHTGAFLWSNGHGIDNEFVTIMSYESSYINATEVGYFSTPNMQCGLSDDPCGVSRENMWDGADNLLTLKTTAIQVGAISNGFGPNIDLANTDPLQLQNIDQLETLEVSANDPEDGDLSQYVTKTISNVDSSEYDYESIFSVTDSDGNRTEQSLKIIIDEMPSINNWDFDQDSNADALTDGLLLLRYAFGLTGDALVSNAIAEVSPLTPEQVQENVAASISFADIDNSGNVDALTDGLLLLRYLFGLTGDALLSSAVAENANRSNATDIAVYIESLMPGS